MSLHYCPNTHADATPCGGNSSWGSALRMERFTLALRTLAAMGLVDYAARTFTCPVTDKTYPFGTPVDVDRPDAGTCYTLGAFVLTSAEGNAARNRDGDPSAEWTARYVAAVADAARNLPRPTGTDARDTYAAFRPTPEAPVTVCQTPRWMR